MLAGSASSSDDDEENDGDEAAGGSGSQRQGRPRTASAAGSRSASSTRAAQQKDSSGLVARLQRQVSLLDEKSREQSRSLHLMRLDNAALLVRFRAAAEQRAKADKRAKTLEAEVILLRGRMGVERQAYDAAHGLATAGDEHQQQQPVLHQAPQPQPLYYEETHDAPY